MAAMVGEQAVEFTLPDTDGEPRWLSEFHRLGPAVLLFVPSAYGWRPRWQFWSLMRHYDRFVEHAAEIVVVTSDPLPELRIFQIRRGFPFIFLGDKGGTAARGYGIPVGGAGALVIAAPGVIGFRRVAGRGRRCSGKELLRALHGV